MSSGWTQEWDQQKNHEFGKRKQSQREEIYF